MVSLVLCGSALTPESHSHVYPDWRRILCLLVEAELFRGILLDVLLSEGQKQIRTLPHCSIAAKRQHVCRGGIKINERSTQKKV